MYKLLLPLLMLLQITSFAQAPAEKYTIDSASVEHAGVPKGEILKFTFENSKIFPGTKRDYWIYIPVQYKADQPACVYVNQDGVQWKAPTVFDNLIHNKEMPVTIGIFVSPGQMIAADGQAANDRFNRSFEYDGLGDNYVKFLLEELLPEVEKQKSKRWSRHSPFKKMGTIEPLADQAAAQFVHLPQRGKNPMNFRVCSAP